MSFFSILFQWKTLLLISQNLVTLKEYLFSYTAGRHHHFHYCLICMGVASPSKRNCTDGGKEWIFVSEIQSTSIMLLIICCRESNLFRIEFMISCAKISLSLFLRRIFFKALREAGKTSLLKLDGVWWNLKNWILQYRFMTRVTKRIW